jgi:hypothetical protein
MEFKTKAALARVGERSNDVGNRGLLQRAAGRAASQEVRITRCGGNKDLGCSWPGQAPGGAETQGGSQVGHVGGGTRAGCC